MEQLQFVIELTENEKDALLPMVVRIFNNRPENQKVVSNAKIRSLLNEFGENVSDAQVRKLIFYIRNNNLVELLIAGKDGYFVSDRIGDISSWITRQRGKIFSMQKTLDSIEAQFKRNEGKLKNGSMSDTNQMSIFDINGVAE